MKTMNDKYGDGSDHDCCPKCDMCIVCGDCRNYGCGNKELHKQLHPVVQPTTEKVNP